MRILLADDEDNIRDVVKLNLELEGFEVVTAVNGKQALKLKDGQHFDLIILDIMMPEINGIQVCEQIRLTDLEVPIIFLTAKESPLDRIKGLKTGADDYISKPFNFVELLLRIQNLLKRTRPVEETGGELYTFDDYWINFKTYIAKGTGEEIALTRKEAMLLKLLMDRENEVVSRQQILQSVWGYDVFPSTRTIDNFILSFRKYFEKDPRNPRFFHSIRGVGYKFTR
ncbi:MAG: response regulator transcription factor [Saprospiraceae bacterium]